MRDFFKIGRKNQEKSTVSSKRGAKGEKYRFFIYNAPRKSDVVCVALALK